MRSLLFIFLAFAGYSLTSPIALRESTDDTVQLPTGRYSGYHDDETGTTTYFAVPYAYASRFEPSKLIDTKPGTSSSVQVNASTHGPACVNFDIPPPYNKGYSILLGGEPIEPQSEDCLNLDVYIPDGAHQDLPVLFYTPGGGFLVGASFPYDMKAMVSRSAAMGKPFIAVAINYRLGPLGFLNPSTWEEINLGILDQVQALHYVKKYISRFGGSPHKVTIMGQSAGAESTMQQLLWTKEKLFRSAWLISVPSSDTPFTKTHPAYKNALVKSYAKACGCPSDEGIEAAVNCLRTTNVKTLTNNSVAWEGSMLSLGGFIENNTFETIRNGEFPEIPLMFSTCRDEGTAQAIAFHPNTTKETSLFIYQLINARGLKGAKAANFLREMLKAYPDDPVLGCPYNGGDTNYGDGKQYKRMAAIATDGTYTEAWTEYLETFSHKTKTWGLLWEEPIPGVPAAYGVTHGSDLVYYFPTLLGSQKDPRNLGQQHLVTTLHDAIVNFVNDGDPNGCAFSTQAYHWPLYSESGMVTVLNASQVATALPPPHRPGFDVLHRYLRPGPLLNGSEKEQLVLS